jgi:mannosyltransferase
MTIGKNIVLDSIIFGLQRFGGISNYWSKLVEYVSNDSELAGTLLLPKKISFSEFDHNWIYRMPALFETIDTRIGRYLSANSAKGGIFHTSYYRLPRQTADKYVVSVYDFTYERFRTGLARFIHSKQKLESIKRADVVLCISEATRQDVIEFCPQIDVHKLHVIHLGVDTSVFYQEPPEFEDINFQTVLFVGQRGGYKRFDLAVEAIYQLPNLTLGIVGPTLAKKEREYLQSRLGRRWQEFGPISTADLRRLYSSCFAFIFSSDYEGFGLPILEAMACGCPVVASALSSLPEVGGTAAFYAENQTGEAYANALEVLNSNNLRNIAVQNGIVRAAKFDWLHTLQMTKHVYLNK